MVKMKNLNNFVMMILCMAFVFAGTQSFAARNTQADTPVDGFIENMGQEAISFLGNRNLSMAQKQQKFRALLDRHFDMDTIGRFSIGSHWKSLSPAQQAEYQSLFEDLIVSIYSSRFADYHGQEFEVESSQPTGSSDYMVQSHIISPDGNIPIGWHVREKNGEFKIVDVSIEDVSMAITKRSEFASIIQRGGGNTEVLMDHLRGKQSG